jgi:Transglutaminase-like superfamily
MKRVASSSAFLIILLFHMACVKQSNNGIPKVEAATYSNGVSGNSHPVFYADTTNNTFLAFLRIKYNLLQIIAGCNTDLQKVIRLTDWVHTQWQHDGNNSPNGKNADQVLTGAMQGARYSCVGYGIALSGCLNAIGLKSRVLGIKRKDVETASCCAGHVCTEVYLNDLQKWIIADAQFDVVPILNNVPLNAYELRNAITNNFNDLILNGAKNNKQNYTIFIAPYLYFFDFNLNNQNLQNYAASKSLLLVPNAVPTPTIFQINYAINNLGVIGTHFIGDFYAIP